MKKPKIKIELSDTGALVEVKDVTSFYGGKQIRLKFFFDTDHKERLVNLLYEINELINVDTSDYAETRVSIKLVHGEKYECTRNNCEICGRI